MADQARILEIERRLNRDAREIAALKSQVLANSQMIPRAFGSGAGGEGSTTHSYFCRTPSGGVAAATGTWPSISPTTMVVDVYKVDGGALVLSASSVDVLWFYKSPSDENKLVPCTPNGDDTFTAVLNSCEDI